MTAGDLNKKFGWIWVIIGPLMGMFMIFKFQEAAAQGIFQEYAASMTRTGYRHLHTHSALLAFFNILYGYGLDEIGLADNTKKLGSYLAIAGAILVPLSFVIGSISDIARLLGFISLVVAILVMAAGQITKK